MESPRDSFRRSPVEVEGRTLIQSECLLCGTVIIGSVRFGHQRREALHLESCAGGKPEKASETVIPIRRGPHSDDLGRTLRAAAGKNRT